MITEEQKEQLAKEKLKSDLRICEETIAKAEKYERLKDNPDWQAHLQDLKVLADLHDKEIEWAKIMLIDAPHDGYLKMGNKGQQEYVSSRQDWVDFIIRHQLQKIECANWFKEPEHIITMAAMARQKVAQIKDKLLEMAHVSGEPSENGKS